MIGDLRIVIMRLVESDPYVYRATPAEPQSARGLIQRDGVREVEFRSLPPLCEQAIRMRAAEHLDPGAQPQIKHKMRISYVRLDPDDPIRSSRLGPLLCPRRSHGSAGNLSSQLNAMSGNMSQANHNRRLKDTLLGVLIALVTAAVLSALYLIYLLWPL